MRVSQPGVAPPIIRSPYLPAPPTPSAASEPVDRLVLAAPPPAPEARHRHAGWRKFGLAAVTLGTVLTTSSCGTPPMMAACQEIASLSQIGPGTCSIAVDPLPTHMVGTSVDGDVAKQEGITNDQLFQRLHDMGFNVVRLGAYWDQVQPNGPSQANFSLLDAQLDAAHKAGLKVILTVGVKAPGWPEFHLPGWVHPQTDDLGDVGEDATFRQQAIKFDRLVVDHVRGRSDVVMFQVENEPLDPSGPQRMRIDPGMLEAEAQAIRQEDTGGRPLMVNVWSENNPILGGDPFGTLKEATKVADVVGIDVYPYPGSTGTDLLRGDRIDIFPKAAYKYVTAHGKRPMVAELQADNWGSYHVTPQDVQQNFQRVEAQGYKDVLFWRQSTVEQELKHGDQSLENEESKLSRQLAQDAPAPAKAVAPQSDAVLNGDEPGMPGGNAGAVR